MPDIFVPKYSESEAAIRSILSGNGGEIISRLSPHEQEVVSELLAAARDADGIDLLNDVWQLDYHKEPPTFQEFIEDPYYFGHLRDSIYPKWKEMLIEGFDPTLNYWEFIMRGCIGSGKSWTASVGTCYEAATLLHMRNPQRTLRLGAASDPIFLGLVSTDKAQVKKGLWPYALGFMKMSPFFTETTNLRTEQEYLTDLTVPFPNNIKIIGGSLPAHIIGSNLYSLAMDEINYRRGSDGQKAAYDFYTKAKNRIENRFRGKTGKGSLFLISSEKDADSFLDAHCKKQKAMEEKTGKSELLVRQFAEWDIVPHRNLGIEPTTPWFKVDAGDTLRPPKILEDGEEPRQGARVVLCPRTDIYWKSANRDLLEFLKERAGVTPGRANKWFYNVDATLNAFTEENTVLTDLVELAIDTLFDASDSVEENLLLRRVMGKPEPRVMPGVPRFVHVDLARVEDKAGFAMAHVCDYAPGGSPIVKVELAVGFKASKEKPIDFDKIIDFIKWLRDVGFNIQLVTYDSWQSYSSQTTLEKLGFKVKTRSMDIMKQTPQGKVQQEYSQFRKLVNEGRVRLPNNARLKHETINLENHDGKPDHPEDGSKDIIDAAVGAVSNTLEMFAENSARGDDFKFEVLKEAHVRTATPQQVLEKENLTTKRREDDEDEFLFGDD